MKLGERYFLSTFILVILLLILLSISTELFFRKYIREDIRKNQKSLAVIYSHVCEEALVSNDFLFLINYTKRVKETNRMVSYVIFMDTKSFILVHTNPELLRTQAPVDLESRTKKISGITFFNNLSKDGSIETTDVISPVRQGSNRVGTAVIGYSQSYYETLVKQELSKFHLYFLLIGLLGLFAGYILSKILARMMILRINRLGDAVVAMSQGNFDANIELKGNDELSWLGGEFNNMAKKLKEVDEIKQSFVSNVTHELRSPIAAIESYASEMLDGGIPQFIKTGLNDITIIRNNAMRLLRLVNDLLDTSKMESGQFELNMRHVNITSPIDTVVKLYEAVKIERKINLILDVPHNIPEVLIDEDRIIQVLSNILNNAIKFTPENGEIILSAKYIYEKPKPYLKVCVKDTGNGIPLPKEQQQIIFDKFTQFKGIKQYGKGPKGMGLGLHISKYLIELHKGKIWVESPPAGTNIGTEVIFTLPF